MSATNHAQLIKKDSEDYLTTALLQLLKTNQLTDLSVTQVVKRAGVSRMAFYRNYKTLDDILIRYLTPIFNESFDDVSEGLTQDDKLQAMARLFDELSDPLDLAMKQGFETIVQQIFNENIIRMYQKQNIWSGLVPDNQKYYTNFMAAGVYGIWREWLLSGKKEPLVNIQLLITNIQASLIASTVKYK